MKKTNITRHSCCHGYERELGQHEYAEMDRKQLEDTGRDLGGTEFLVLLPEEKVTESVQTNNAIENFDRDFRTKTNYKNSKTAKRRKNHKRQ